MKGLGLKYFLCVNLFQQGGSIRSPFCEKQRNLQLSSKYSFEYQPLNRNHRDTSDQTKHTKLPGCRPCRQVKQSPEDTAEETPFKRFDSAALVEAWLVLASVGAAEWRECQVTLLWTEFAPPFKCLFSKQQGTAITQLFHAPKYHPQSSWQKHLLTLTPSRARGKKNM